MNRRFDTDREFGGHHVCHLTEKIKIVQGNSENYSDRKCKMSIHRVYAGFWNLRQVKSSALLGDTNETNNVYISLIKCSSFNREIDIWHLSNQTKAKSNDNKQFLYLFPPHSLITKYVCP